MSDKRSPEKTVKIEDLETVYKTLSRQLARIRVVLDDAKSVNKKSLKVQYMQSAKTAQDKLETFTRGIERTLN